MIPWETLDAAPIPGAPGRLRLMRRGSEFAIRLDDNDLMNSRLRGSEEALAVRGCAHLAARRGARVLVGGLGMGFTLRAALAALPPDARVLVAELVPEVIAWARGPLAPVFAGILDDPRVALHVGDVAEPIAAARAGFDAILLDVDNGPEGLTRPDNDALYGPAGLGAIRRALAPAGVLAIWSVVPDARFSARLRRADFRVEESTARAGGRRGARHHIWLARRG